MEKKSAVQAHRERMRAKGHTLKQLWLPKGREDDYEAFLRTLEPDFDPPQKRGPKVS